MRGSRVQAVVNELQGEKIDIIPWSPDAATFIVNALQPAEVMKVVLDEDSTRIEVVVPDDQLSLAIGRRGQNVRLASQLTGWDIDILTEAEESERRQKEFVERTSAFMERARRRRDGRPAAGFRGLPHGRGDRLCRAARARLGSKASTPRPPAEIQARAQGHLARIEAEYDERRKALGVADELKEIEGLTTPMLVKLGENGVKTSRTSPAAPPTISSAGPTATTAKEAVGFLSGFDVSREQADAMIMDARVRAGWIEAAARPRCRSGEAADEDAGG